MWGHWHHPMAPRGAKWKGPKWKQHCPYPRRQPHCSWWAHSKARLCGFSTEPRVLTPGSPSITELTGSQAGWRESSISNQTPACLWQICPHRPFSEQSTAEPQPDTSLKRPVLHLIEFQLSVQKAWCFFTSATSSAAAARVPGAPFPPTSQDLLTWEVCHYLSLPIVLKQCPRWVVEGLLLKIFRACGYSNTSAELPGGRCVNNCFQSLGGQQN